MVFAHDHAQIPSLSLAAVSDDGTPNEGTDRAGGDGWQNSSGTAWMGTDAHKTKRVGRRGWASPKRPPKPLQKMTVFVPAFYVVQHKILKIEHQNYHFRVTKPKMWDNGM